MLELLELRGATRWYPPASYAVDHVGLELRRCDTVMITGPAGSGKTSLAKLAASYEHPDDGMVLYNGHDTSDMKASELDRWRSQIELLDTEHGFFRRLTFKENYMLLNRLHQYRHRENFEEFMEPYGLEGLGMRRQDQLTPAQLCRMKLAFAMLKKPSLIIADDFMRSLKLEEREEIWAFMKDLQQAWDFMLLVLADHEEAFDGIGRSYRIKEGMLDG
jgi:ABC-type lipoprotein export system ATPase subunit